MVAEVFDRGVYTKSANLIMVRAERIGYERLAFGIYRDDVRLALYVGASVLGEDVEEATIDMSDYIRTQEVEGHKSGVVTVKSFGLDGSDWIPTGDEINVDYNIVGLYDMTRILRPDNWVGKFIYCQLGEGGLAMKYTDTYPPKMMINPFGSNAIVASWQVAYGVDADIEPRLMIGSRVIHCVVTQENRAVIIPTQQDGVFVAYSANYGQGVRTRIVPRQDNREYCLVRWTFPTGAQLVHVMEYRDVTDTVANSQEMDVIGDRYDVRKGIGQTLVLHLDNLEPYDYWYYGTIATSSKVEVAFDMGESTIRDWHSVNVTTKKIEQPNMVSRKSLDIEVKLNEYGAL